MTIQDLLHSGDLIHKQNVKKFIRRFANDDNWHNLDVNNANLGYGWIHYSLIRALGMTKILVIGSKLGYIPAICAMACKDNKNGFVDFVDANYNVNNPAHEKNHWGGVAFWNKKNAVRQFSSFHLNDYIRMHVMTSSQFARRFSGDIWNYIYIDGDHSYTGVRRDFETFWPRVMKGGYLGLHDIYTKDLGNLEYGVYRYWKSLRRNHPHMLEFPGKCGLGLIQK